MTMATVFTASRPEAMALRRGGVTAHRVGVGRESAERAGPSRAVADARAVAVAGIAGGLHADLRTGDVVVATEVRSPERTVRCPSAPILAGELERRGLTVHTGPVVSADHVVTGAERDRLAADGALCVDMESAWLLGTGDAPAAVVRVIADVADAPLLRPATAGRMVGALRTLSRTGEALAAWSRAVDSRHVLLAGPRSFCAGVVRAVDVVERALERRGAPVYVRKQIVHNVHVVGDLQRRGAVFVDELDEVPRGATVVFSAHGVSPAVRAEADERGLDVIDATCPLVSKVHAEVRRFADAGDTVIFIGHAGHEESTGTMGERPDDTVLVQDADDARMVAVADPDRVSYILQTTLAADEVAGIVDILRARFPQLREPPSEDICYATTNRQDALQQVASEADLALVIGSTNSSNSRRLVEKSERLGTPAYLVDDAGDIELSWLNGAATVAVTAGASAPSELVEDLVEALGGLGDVTVVQRDITTENVHFTLPKEVRPA